uniref:Uncharacterized protein n=1 Tax=Oryza rufipogon TaxID=4529 RepID=A0A0E0RFC9_ORYRU
MCRNYAYNLEKPKPVPKGKKGKAKMPVKWIYKEMTEFYKGMIQTWREHQKEHEERQRQRAAKEKAERERREELDLREFARLNREKEEGAKDQARKLDLSTSKNGALPRDLSASKNGALPRDLGAISTSD